MKTLTPIRSHAPANTSTVRAFVSLVTLTFRRQLRMGAMAWATLFLVAIVTGVVAILTVWRAGWDFETRWSNRNRVMYRNYPETLDKLRMLPMPAPALGIETAVHGHFRTLLADDQFKSDYALANFSRWVVFGLYLGFLLPLINLAFASQALGGEREQRTLIWLLTRPLPRPAIYLAKWLGMLPWCLAVSLGSLFALGFAGGAVGRDAAITFAPAAVLGCFAFASVFHLVGSVLNRPAVMGLAYIFFFETLVANLPGSLKQLSLNYYVRSLMYDVTAARLKTLSPEALDVYAPADMTSSAITLIVTTLAVTVLGAWWFGRAEPKEEI